MRRSALREGQGSHTGSHFAPKNYASLWPTACQNQKVMSKCACRIAVRSAVRRQSHKKSINLTESALRSHGARLHQQTTRSDAPSALETGPPIRGHVARPRPYARRAGRRHDRGSSQTGQARGPKKILRSAGGKTSILQGFFSVARGYGASSGMPIFFAPSGGMMYHIPPPLGAADRLTLSAIQGKNAHAAVHQCHIILFDRLGCCHTHTYPG